MNVFIYLISLACISDSRLTRYLLQRLLGTDSGGGLGGGGGRAGGRSLLRQRDRAAAEAQIFSEDQAGAGSAGGAARIVYPQYSRPNAGAAAGFEPVPAASSRVDSLDLLDEFAIRRYLDEAKEQLDVIDFRRSR